jgi:hypothetical protein
MVADTTTLAVADRRMSLHMPDLITMIVLTIIYGIVVSTIT